MKLKITEIDHDDLVNLFSTALYGSYIFSTSYDSIEYEQLEDKSEKDCYEDKIARLLLAGKAVEVFDGYAEDADDYYGKLPHTWEDELMCYTITLKDIKKGLQKAINTNGWDMKCAMNLINSDGDFDLPQAENLLQIITFGEAIYG